MLPHHDFKSDRAVRVSNFDTRSASYPFVHPDRSSCPHSTKCHPCINFFSRKQSTLDTSSRLSTSCDGGLAPISPLPTPTSPVPFALSFAGPVSSRKQIQAWLLSWFESNLTYVATEEADTYLTRLKLSARQIWGLEERDLLQYFMSKSKGFRWKTEIENLVRDIMLARALGIEVCSYAQGLGGYALISV